VPVGTADKVRAAIAAELSARGVQVAFDVVSNPEFLKEGAAVNDCMRPDRIVLGVESKKARTVLTELYKPLKAPIVFTDIKSAEIIKHASNSFLSMKISFINAISRICELADADVDRVVAIVAGMLG